jgi:thioredoxin-related protein
MKRRLIAAGLLMLASLLASAAVSAELVFVEVSSCAYCIRFNKHSAPAYQQSEIGRQVPLRRVNLMQRWPEDLKAVDRPPYTPVFILVENGRELGRFNGYVGPRQFDRDVRRLLKRRG